MRLQSHHELIVQLIKFLISLLAWAVISTWTVGRASARITTELIILSRAVDRLELRLDQHIDRTTTIPGGKNGPQKNSKN